VLGDVGGDTACGVGAPLAVRQGELQ
jgi:hypothetical protein